MTAQSIDGIEEVAYEGRMLAQVIWSRARVAHTTFVSPAASSMQFGLIAHTAGYTEPAHTHPTVTRSIDDVQQMFVVQHGVVAVDLFRDDGSLLRTLTLRAGDAILLMDGIHRIRVLEDAQCITVKQGPFMGAEHDKIVAQVNA